ncbi:MAG: 50S ribosomal protein L13 [Bacteroidales bacterium]|nr:50S ribosomal protein L13 [Bacteroidales bacterium]
MDTLSYKTVSANKATVNKQWLLIDATDQILGRLASKVAKTLRGKNKPNFTPHVDCGDNVIVINADKIKLTGNKLQDRVKYSYSGYPGGRHDKTMGEILEKDSRRLIEHAVKGMLPKNRLGAKLLKNLKVYKDENHEQEAQQPKKIDLNEIY